MNTTRYCLALDLLDDTEAISTYKKYHEKIWPEITSSIRDAGISHMEIYQVANRVFMIIETKEGFSFENKAALDASNPKVQEWEALMDQFQQRLPGTPNEVKWVLMDKIFDLQING